MSSHFTNAKRHDWQRDVRSGTTHILCTPEQMLTTIYFAALR